MRIVVVGATGNLGTALLRAVAGRSSITHVDAVSRRGPGALPAPEPGTARVVHHLLDAASPAGSPDADALAHLAAGADAVVHLAWTQRRGADRTTRANLAITQGVLRAARGARQLVVASSALAYAPSFGETRRDESWPVTGVVGSAVSQDKAGLERLTDAFAAANPGLVVTRLRPAITLQESAGAELVRRYVGPLMPRFGLGIEVPVLLWPEGLGLQVAHADDVAAAFLSAIERRAPGAYNVASPEVLDGEGVAEAIGARRLVEVPQQGARLGHTIAWHVRAVAASPDWLSALAATPVLDTRRAAQLLGITPRWNGLDVLSSAARGVAQRREGWTPALSRSREPKELDEPDQLA